MFKVFWIVAEFQVSFSEMGFQVSITTNCKGITGFLHCSGVQGFPPSAVVGFMGLSLSGVSFLHFRRGLRFPSL